MATDAAVGELWDYDFDLPPHLIASRPTDRRDASRLLEVDRSAAGLEDRRFFDLPDLLARGDALVLNDSRVFPARLLGEKPTGARAEVLLLRPHAPDDARPIEAFRHEAPREWEAIVRPGGKLKPGRRVRVAADFEIEILSSGPDGTRIVRLEGGEDPWALIERYGRVPLPPYLGRADDPLDRDRYQTIYAAERGSVAAPTAGLHFTPRLLARIRAAGVEVVRVTLHVGPGTFRPVSEAQLTSGRLHREAFRVGPEAAERLESVRSTGGRIWCVGTTSCRVLETAVGPDGSFRHGQGWTDLFIRPPYRFRAVDGLVTNFHLPGSSLLMLVAAFAGVDRIRSAYAHAVERGYRFYSYGDAMVIR